MKKLALILISSTLFAAGQEEAAKTKPADSEVPAAIATQNNTRSMIVIDPKVRAQDYVEAFDLLHKDRPTQRIMMKTTDETLTNVNKISSNGTLLIVKTLSNQGLQTTIVPVEHVMEISYSP